MSDQKPNVVVRVADAVWAGPLGFLEQLGQHARLFWQIITWGLRPPFRLRLIIEQMDFVGVGSLGIVGLVGLFSGMVLALQGVIALRQFQAERIVGGVVGLTLTRELAPVMTCLMLTARAGSGMATELGSMRITEQIDALTTFAVNPIQYLLYPRVLATTIVAPLMTALFAAIGCWGGYLVAVYLMNVDGALYTDNLLLLVDPKDITLGLMKAMAFGATLSTVACYQGFNAEGGAKGVGLATTRAVVYASVLVLVLDYFLTDILLPILGIT